MSASGLTALQIRVLETLAGLEPAWTLTGGGALVGFHLRHRTTRDLDLFLHDRATLEDYASRVIDRLRAVGLEVRSLQTGTSMHRLQVATGSESIVLDLVADPVPVIEEPVEHTIGTATIRVDTEHEILVNKLCALVQRSEPRDLLDVRGLLARGGDLQRALTDAPSKDSGFSILTLTWLVKDLPIRPVGSSDGWSEERITALEEFRASLIERLGDLARPDSD
jgi:hypothetical protein